jgi:DNA-binding PucR family transcriptional regulator
VRDQLSSLQGLLVLAMLMTERNDVEEILGLATSAAPSLGPCRLDGAYLEGTGWLATDGPCRIPSVRREIEMQFAVLSAAGGALGIRGENWGWAYPLRSVQGHFGYLIVGADQVADDASQFLLRVLAQQTGIAIANARLHVRERDAARELRDTNRTLAATIAALERSTAIHERLTAVALSGEGQEGIAQALHDLTGYAVAAEDAYGNLRAWAGPGRPTPYPKAQPMEREALVRRARDEQHPIRVGDRLVALADAGDGAVGVIALVDPDATAGPQETTALEHGATVLATELARLRSIAESELRVGHDLMDQLLSDGADVSSASARAQALGYDIERPHRVVVVEPKAPARSTDEFCHAVRRAARDQGVGTLLIVRDESVVLLSDAEPTWVTFQEAVAKEIGGAPNRTSVGGRYDDPALFARSYREALFVAKLAHAAGLERAAVYDDLGVYRLFAVMAQPDELERFASRWLTALVDYDAVHNASLVATLSRYLESGRSHELTAKALNVHRSTLKYRLQRVSQIGGHDLNDPDTCFNLHLSCRAWQTLEVLRGG